MASRIFEFRVIRFDSVFHLYECTKELVLSTKKRRTICAPQQSFLFSRSRRFSSSAGSRRCTSSTTTPSRSAQPATGRTRSIQGRDQRQLQQRPSIRAGRTLPGTQKYFDFMAKYYADGDAQPTGAGPQERRIRRLTSELWF